MHREIFQQGLAVETVSFYLLCCGAAPSGQPIDRQQLAAIWNSSEAAMDAAIEELLQRGILTLVPSEDEQSTPRYRPAPPNQWRRPAAQGPSGQAPTAQD